MCYYFLSQRYEHEYVVFIKVEKDINHAAPHAIHATYHNPWIR